jgi:hypothetical protein
MYKTFGQRILVLCLAATLFLTAYAIAKYYSPSLVAHVVKQALIEKAPAGMSPALVRERFEKLMAADPSNDKLEKMLALSNYLEKVQKLTPAELERLLANRE